MRGAKRFQGQLCKCYSLKRFSIDQHRPPRVCGRSLSRRLDVDQLSTQPPFASGYSRDQPFVRSHFLRNSH